MSRRERAAWAAAAALQIWAIAASAQDELTTRERGALAPRAANRVVQQDLFSVLEPVKGIHSGMSRQLRGVGLTTHAFGTEFNGLCRRDTVWLRYAPTAEGDKPEDLPVRPYGVEAQTTFHVLKLFSGAREHPAQVWDARCASVGHDENANWFTADDARTAVQGVLVLQAAVSALRTRLLKSEPCSNIFFPKDATCEQAVLQVGDPSHIDSIKECPSDAGAVCYVIDLAASTKLTIKARMSDEELFPSAVTSIAVEQYVIVT